MQTENTADIVHILMATYNGASFIGKQIQSLVDQTHDNWRLIIRDDGSSDNTVSIIEDCLSRDSRVTLVSDDFGNLRSSQNFSKLMEAIPAEASYIMFCDQDDIWIPHKIERSLHAIKELEHKHGKDQNLMVYGTYTMIDDLGASIPAGVPNYSVKPDLKLLLSQNYIYGCTMMINRNLLNLASPVPLTAENHDYWIALTALVNDGHIAYIKEPLLFYRQHLQNVSGSFANAFLLNRIRRLFSQTEAGYLRNRLKMFISLSERFGSTIRPEVRALLNGQIRALTRGGWNAFLYNIRHGIGRIGMSQTALYYLNVLRLKKLKERV